MIVFDVIDTPNLLQSCLFQNFNLPKCHFFGLNCDLKMDEQFIIKNPQLSIVDWCGKTHRGIFVASNNEQS